MGDANEFMRRLDSDPEVRALYDARGYGVQLELIRARKMAGLSQQDLADRMGTNKSVVCRLESPRAATKPSWSSIERYAEAVGMRPRLVFEPISLECEPTATQGLPSTAPASTSRRKARA